MAFVWKSGESALNGATIHWANPKIRLNGYRVLVEEKSPTEFVVRYDLLHGKFSEEQSMLYGPFETLEAAKVLCEFLGEPEQ